MGRQSSGVRGGLQPGDSSYHGKIGRLNPLKAIQDKQVYKAVGEAISRYHSVLGVRQQEIKLAELADNTLGVHVTENGKSSAIYLNSSKFKTRSKQEIIDQTRKGYKSGWHTVTNKPIAHTVTHELAHATWNDHLTGKNQRAAASEIRGLYKSWMKDKSKTGYGTYAKTNVNEFWAETVTKAVHGTSDPYTKEVKRIIKKYKL